MNTKTRTNSIMNINQYAPEDCINNILSFLNINDLYKIFKDDEKMFDKIKNNIVELTTHDCRKLLKVNNYDYNFLKLFKNLRKISFYISNDKINFEQLVKNISFKNLQMIELNYSAYYFFKIPEETYNSSREFKNIQLKYTKRMIDLQKQFLEFAFINNKMKYMYSIKISDNYYINHKNIYNKVKTIRPFSIYNRNEFLKNYQEFPEFLKLFDYSKEYKRLFSYHYLYTDDKDQKEKINFILYHQRFKTLYANIQNDLINKWSKNFIDELDIKDLIIYKNRQFLYIITQFVSYNVIKKFKFTLYNDLFKSTFESYNSIDIFLWLYNLSQSKELEELEINLTNCSNGFNFDHYDTLYMILSFLHEIVILDENETNNYFPKLKVIRITNCQVISYDVSDTEDEDEEGFYPGDSTWRRSEIQDEEYRKINTICDLWRENKNQPEFIIEKYYFKEF